MFAGSVSPQLDWHREKGDDDKSSVQIRETHFIIKHCLQKEPTSDREVRIVWMGDAVPAP